jgi:hypothetical protein
MKSPFSSGISTVPIFSSTQPHAIRETIFILPLVSTLSQKRLFENMSLYRNVPSELYPYNYAPLKNPDSIRVLCLRPAAEDNEAVDCELIDFEFHDGLAKPGTIKIDDGFMESGKSSIHLEYYEPIIISIEGRKNSAVGDLGSSDEELSPRPSSTFLSSVNSQKGVSQLGASKVTYESGVAGGPSWPHPGHQYEALS